MSARPLMLSFDTKKLLRAPPVGRGFPGSNDSDSTGYTSRAPEILAEV
jgi:hypothetical protein